MSATNNDFPQLAVSQSNKELRINELLDMLTGGGSFARDPDTTTALTWGYLGGMLFVDGVWTTVAAGTVTLTISTTNYVERTRAGVVSTNTTGFTAGRLPLYTVVTDAGSTVSSYVDHRIAHNEPGVSARLSKSVAGSSDATLTAAEARCAVLNFTGILTGDIDVIVPNGPQEWTVTNNTTGSFSLTVKTSAGTGVVITQGAVHQVLADGTNVVNTATPAGAVSASGVSITDAGTYYTGTDVEDALQEIGADIAALSGGSINIPAQRYTIDTGSTADSDPGAGLLKFNHATPSSATAIYIDDSTNDSVDLSTFLASLGATGWIKIQSEDDAGEWMIFRWTAVTDDTGYFDFTVTHQASKGTLDDADDVLVSFDSDANTGSGGSELRGLTFTSDTGSTADSDPGAGLMKWNNATQGSATKLFFDNTTLDSITITSFFAALGTNGVLFMQQDDDETRWQLWEIDTATADSGYYDFAVTLLAKSAADIEDAKTVYCDFQKGPGAGSTTAGRHSVWIGAGAMQPSVTGGCEFFQTSASAANQPDLAYLSFDTTTEEYAQFSLAMPKSWDEGTVTFKPVWSHPATVTNFDTEWELQAIALSNDDAIAQNFGTTQTSSDTGGTTDDIYVGPESSAITIAGTPAAEDVVFFRVSRNVGGSDNLAVDARLHGIILYMTTDAENDA
jgi:hypothetical protein